MDDGYFCKNFVGQYSFVEQFGIFIVVQELVVLDLFCAVVLEAIYTVPVPFLVVNVLF